MNMENEIWKPIKDYEGLYEVSNFGRIKSLEKFCLSKCGSFRKRKELIKKPNKTKWGYYNIELCKNAKPKTFRLHKLVAEAFLEVPDELKHLIGTRYLHINHKDEDKTNNRVENLEYCTARYNNNYGSHNEKMIRTKSKPVLQYDLQGNLVKEWSSAKEAERVGGFNNGHINSCIHGKYRFKTHKGYIWKFKNND